MDPLSLVPRRRLHLIRFHGVLASCFKNDAKLRARVVPQAPAATSESELTATESGCAHGRPARISWVPRLEFVLQIDLEHCLQAFGALRSPAFSQSNSA